MIAPIHDYVSDIFDALSHIAKYRRIIALRDAANTAAAKAEWQALADHLKKQWAQWQGDDSLHEIASRIGLVKPAKSL